MMALLYHGTSSIYLESIKKNGLKATPDYTYPDPSTYGIPIVQLTTNKTVAKLYAMSRCYQDKINEKVEEIHPVIWDVPPMHAVGGEPILVTVKIPTQYLLLHGFDGHVVEVCTFFDIHPSEIVKIEYINESLAKLCKDMYYEYPIQVQAFNYSLLKEKRPNGHFFSVLKLIADKGWDFRNDNIKTRTEERCC
jgi:hypothetical protein